MPGEYKAPDIDTGNVKKILKRAGLGGKSKFGSGDGFKFIMIFAVFLLLFLTNEEGKDVIMLDSFIDMTDNDFTRSMCYFQAMETKSFKFFHLSPYNAVIAQKTVLGLTLMIFISFAMDAKKKNHIEDFLSFIEANKNELGKHGSTIVKVRKFLLYDLFAKVVFNLISPAVVSGVILVIFLDSNMAIDRILFPPYFRCSIDQTHLSTRKIEERIRIGKHETLEDFKDLTETSSNGKLTELNQDQMLVITAHIKGFSRRNYLLLLNLIVLLIICFYTFGKVFVFMSKYRDMSDKIPRISTGQQGSADGLEITS
ncbi:MAG: hypothetical protein MHMPM18_000044 [Marteilia pararefringens]